MSRNEPSTALELEEDEPAITIQSRDYWNELKKNRKKSTIHKVLHWKPSVFSMPLFWFVVINFLLILALAVLSLFFNDNRLWEVRYYQYALFVLISFNILAISITLVKCAIRLIQFLSRDQRVLFYTHGTQRACGFLTWVLFVLLFHYIFFRKMEPKAKKVFNIIRDELLVVAIAWLFINLAVKWIVERVRHKEMEQILMKEDAMETVFELSTGDIDSKSSSFLKKFYGYLHGDDESSIAYEFTSTADCIEHSTRFFKRYTRGKDFLDINDFQFLFVKDGDFLWLKGDPKYHKNIFALFRKSEGGKIYEDDFVESMKKMDSWQKKRVANIGNEADIAGVVSYTIGTILWFITLCIGLIVAGVDVQSLLLPFGTFFLSLTFVFGGSLSNAFNALIFLLFVNGFDVGDVVVIDGKKVIIEEVSLLTTRAKHVDGRNFLFQNSNLAGSTIENISRSGDYTFSGALQIDASTPLKVIEELKKTYFDHLKANKKKWRVDGAAFRIGSIDDNNSVHLSMWAPMRFIHWEEAGGWLSGSHELYKVLLDKCNELGVSYKQPPLPVKLEGEKVASPF